MPSKSSGGKKQRRAQGGGRTANSEPRLQVYTQFSGCNFELSPRDPAITSGRVLGRETFPYSDHEQSDLQMNYVAIQNNCKIASNKTIETRNSIQLLREFPDSFRCGLGVTFLAGDVLYVAGVMTDPEMRPAIIRTRLSDPTQKWNEVSLDDRAGQVAMGSTRFLDMCMVDDRLVVASETYDAPSHRIGRLWAGDMDSGLVCRSISNARSVDRPAKPTMDNIQAMGSLKVSATMSDDTPHRVAVAWTYVSMFGPTAHSDQFSFYASMPVANWHAGAYVRLHGTAPTGQGILAVECYFNAGDASSLQFCGRTDLPGEDGGDWSVDWIGYLDDTSMWTMANLVAPEQDYTGGAPCSRLTMIDGRMYFWGDYEHPYRLYIGGNPGNLLSVSSGTGGGFADVEPGTAQEIMYVEKYKTQAGSNIVTMLCSSPNSSQEQRYNLVENTVTLSNEQSMKSWNSEEVSGAVGCVSEHGALVCEDGLYSISRYGLALTTLTMEYNSQVRANYVSDPVKPAFTDDHREHFDSSWLLDADGVLYLKFGSTSESSDDMLFCYDVQQQAWWTETIGDTTLDGRIVGLLHIDWHGAREGIGLVTPTRLWLLPTTEDDPPDKAADFEVIIVTGELATQQPQQQWQYLSQMEFRFDWFIGDLDVTLDGIDMFGRHVKVSKRIHHDEVAYDLSEWMRVDLRLQSYRLTFRGEARFRMTHFIGKTYTLSSKLTQVWGFDSSQSFRTEGDIRPTFRSYNDIVKAIEP